MLPIGIFHCDAKRRQDAPRQGVLGAGGTGIVLLKPRMNFEQALRDLEGFERIWLIFQFHHNRNWRPTAHPPGRSTRVGVFASRSPYRPNPLGLTCVRLVAIDGLAVHVADHDLLDGTPILDIKPYLPYADAFPDARAGWTEARERRVFGIEYTDEARRRLDWLEDAGIHLRPFIVAQLSEHPTDEARKRIARADTGADDANVTAIGSIAASDPTHIIGWRTWRIAYVVDEGAAAVRILTVESGYTLYEMMDTWTDPFGDKAVHRRFREET